jgi:fatty-acyl-CoA synthase
MFTALLDRARDLPERAYLVARLAQETGMLWDVRREGGVELARALLRGAQNPSLIYRIHGANVPDRLGVVMGDVAWTFRELDERIDRIARGLRRRGVRRGTSLLVMLKNRPEFLLVSAACARLGAAAVAVSWRSRPDELAYLVNHSGARALVVEAALLDVVDEASRAFEDPVVARNVYAVGPGARAGAFATPFDDLYAERGRYDAETGADDEAAVVVYTSGTTGKPKGAVRKFPKETLAGAVRFLLETPLRTADVHLVACPMYHSTAFGFLSLSHITGATAVLLEEWKPEAFLAAVARHRVTTTAVVPTMLHRVLALPPEVRAAHDARSLRVVFSGGAPLSGTLATSFMDAYGDVLYNFYGATETGLVTLGKPADLRAAPGTIGHALPGNEVLLLDEAGRPVAPGAVGELYVRNKMLVAGYHRDAAATAQSMRDEYFSVGDLARRDADGRYFIEGRKRDMIISGGVNVYPVEIECALEAHPDVAEAAVVGVPDEEWGERVRAYVVARDGATLDHGELTAWLRGALSGAKVPRELVTLAALPRNPTGKVLKRELASLAPVPRPS